LTDRQREYALKQSLEQEFGDLLPALNAGQIYATLGRLERDGLVLGQAVPGDGRGKRVYELTDAGRAALAAWIELPVSGRRLKDEFFMKFIVVASMQPADSTQLLEGSGASRSGSGSKTSSRSHSASGSISPSSPSPATGRRKPSSHHGARSP
jgi:DNA-binding MarR family transcriptional regulator